MSQLEDDYEDHMMMPSGWQGMINQSNAYAPDINNMMGANYLALQKPAPPPPQLPADAAPGPEVPPVPQTELEKYFAQNNKMDAADLAGYKRQSQAALGQQVTGLKTLEDYIRTTGAKPQGTNFTPLAAYVDSLSPNSHLAEAAKSMAPMTPEEHDKMMMELELKLQGGRSQLSKDQLESLGQQLKMKHDNRRDDMMAKKYTGVLDSKEQMAAQRQYLQDKTLGAYIPRADGAIKILNLLDAGERGEFKTNKAMLGQVNAEIARLETGSNAVSLTASEKTEINDLRTTMADIQNTIDGHVTGVDLKEKFEQMRGMVRDLAKSTNDQIESRHATLLAGATPAQQPVFNAKINAYRDSYKNRYGETLKSSEPSAGPKGPTIVQNGHTYNWNPKTKGYE